MIIQIQKKKVFDCMQHTAYTYANGYTATETFANLFINPNYKPLYFFKTSSFIFALPLYSLFNISPSQTLYTPNTPNTLHFLSVFRRRSFGLSGLAYSAVQRDSPPIRSAGPTLKRVDLYYTYTCIHTLTVPQNTR